MRVREVHGEGSSATVFDVEVGADGVRSVALGTALGGVTGQLTTFFMPEGYPDSVTDDYMAFQWCVTYG